MSSWNFDLRGHVEEEVKKAIEKHLGEKESENSPEEKDYHFDLNSMFMIKRGWLIFYSGNRVRANTITSIKIEAGYGITYVTMTYVGGEIRVFTTYKDLPDGGKDECLLFIDEFFEWLYDHDILPQ